MESISVMTRLLPSSSPMTSTGSRDVESGYHRYLSVERVEASLESRKVSVLFSGGRWKRAQSLFGIAGISLITTIGSIVIFLFPALFVCPTTDDDFDEDRDPRCFFSVFIGGPIAIGLSVCSFLSLVSCIFSGYQRYSRRMSQDHNSRLSQLIHQLSYSASTDEPLTANDFVTLFQENVLDENLIGDLSFTQIRDIRRICIQLDADKPLEREGSRIRQFVEDHWNFRQKAPWERMKIIQESSLKDLREILSDEYFRTRIEDTPGFLDELLSVLSVIASESSDAQAVIIENMRDIISRRFSYAFTDEELLQAMQGIASGGDLQKCFCLVMSQDRMITLICGEITIDLPASVLSNGSNFFRAQLDFEPEIQEMNLEEFPHELFEVFIQYLRGEKMPINQDNVDQFLSIANYFEVSSLAEACQTPLLLKYEGYDLESKLDLLEKFPILRGRFQEHVDQECAGEFSLSDHITFVEHYTRMRLLGLDQTMITMKAALFNEIDVWVKKEAYVFSFDHFVEKVHEFQSYLPGHQSLTEKLVKIIHNRLASYDGELLSLYKLVSSHPTYLMVTALYKFVFADQHQHQVYSTFPSVISVKETIGELKAQFESDQLLISRIKKWDGESGMRGSFDEFITQILEFYSSIQTESYRKEIEDLLIEIIQFRVANEDTHTEMSALEARARENSFLERAIG